MSIWKKILVVVFGVWLLFYKPFVLFNHPHDPNNVLSWVQFGIGVFVVILIIAFFLQDKKQKYENKL
jgi:hypothetical protein